MEHQDVTGVQAALSAIQRTLDRQGEKLEVVRDAVVKMEAQTFGVQIADVRISHSTLRDKVLILETRASMWAAGVAAGTSILCIVVATAICWALGIPGPHVG